MKLKKTLKSVIALSMAVMTVFPTLPTAFAAQQNSYHDPAEHWQEANDRTNELDANAVITHETFQCRECKQPTSFLAYRTPEYTRDGETAMNRNVKYSDGTTIDGDGKGNVNDGTPGKDAYYTGYHWTKSVCETCGTINSNMAKTDYSYGKNVYWLYDCAANFFEDLPERVEIEQVDRDYHRVVTTGGQYCGFCYGTYHTEDTKLERHNMETSIRPELAHQRFVEMAACADCGYTKTSYTAAKAVVADYYGVADGAPHTVTVSDLSEAGVTTAIRYGHSADACTLTSAPNYTEAGNYTVYYKITYTYADTDMVEDGVAYVHLTSTSDGSCGCGCGDPDCDCQNPDCGGDCCNQDCTHHFVCHDTVPPTCVAIGYDRMMCTECGKMVKANYKNALDHAYQSVIVREATCETPGKTMDICERCGNVKESTIPQTEHEYETQVLPSTCTSPGYTLNECTVCGDRHITDITPALSHDYAAKTIPAGCETGGKTIHTCAGCGSAFVTDYTEPLGHSWDEGTEITGSTCTGEGMTEYTCTRCGATRLEGDAAAGHIPGEAATCTTPQRCTKCGAVIANALGHDYQKKITDPTCTEMGYTTCTCSRCGDTYKDDYTDAAGHKLSDWIIDHEPTTDSKGSKHKECTVCGETLETAEIEKIYNQATTDSKGEAIVGGYLVTVSDTDTKNPVAGATVNLHEDKSLSIHLPSGRLLDYADQTTITVLLTKDKSAVADMFIAVTDQQDNYCADSTDVSGQITVPNNGGTTNSDGNATAGWEDADGNRHTLTIKVERTETGRPIQGSEVNIGATGNITVTLPEGQDMDASNRITITVTDNKKTPQPDQTVIVKTDLGSAAQGQTNKDGKLTVPSVDSVYTDESGTAVVGQYTVIVTDTEKAPIKGALVTLLPGTDDAKDAFTVLLPNGRLLDGNDQTIVTVLLPNTNPAKGFHVKVSDAKDNHTAKDTDKNGQVIVPDATGSSGEIVGTDTGSEEQSNTVNVDVADQDGKPIDDAQIAVDKNGEVSITLPDDFDFDKNGSVTVTVTDNQGEGKPNVNVTVTDAAGNTAVGETGKDGTVTLPGKYHFAYIIGYGDGTVGPDRNMTRGEAAAVFARILAEYRHDSLEDVHSSKFPDVDTKAWYANHVAYLEKLGVVVGFDDGKFHAEASITREQFVTMCVRLNDWMALTTYESNQGGFPDVKSSWAAEYIQEATRNGWIVGYPDGNFHGGAKITRAEVVTIINRMLNRTADEAFIRHNKDRLAVFHDLQNPHYWAYYDLMEAANGHSIVNGSEQEVWHEVK